MNRSLWSRLAVFLIAGLLLTPVAFAQLPASATLSEKDAPLFRAEVERIESLLTYASDKVTVTYVMARTWASAKQWPQAVEWLRKTAGTGLDPSRDPAFADVQKTAEFESIMTAVREATPPVSHSARAFEIPEGDLVPESMAYDPHRKQFYFGSAGKGKIIRCSASGECSNFAEGLGSVLGLKIRGDGLWALSNADMESALIHFDLLQGAVLGKYAIPGPGHEFNDLAFTPEGDVYLTDTPAAVVLHLAKGTTRLTQLRHPFDLANGIATSPDGRLLFVSTFGDGISVMDLKTRAVAPVAHPPDLCLGMIDGLYFERGSLLAIQNGFVSPRVVRMHLSRDLRSIERFDVLERRNPLFDGVTTGVVVGRDFYFMANTQDEKKSGFNPIAILKLNLN
ncbi:MAG: hypothetical protein LAO79_16555 [Acidobacteriia bacterium]|nr:hypothetical protein [Terriglobia bacterium]